ncbi:transmembrane protein 126A [Strongylocentrotus purpuratus]|uniref:Transmembrane protein 126A n=1 Tax=Strongylocentrotus purpuratus TaxID=7668 RepID=A0A7M7SX84_STRPU|nr:transmembrane protein 126A [Strongylocentrotus purpuratus]
MTTVPQQLKDSKEQREVISVSAALKEQYDAIKALGGPKAWPFVQGNPLVAFNTGLVGLVSNSFFRRMLMVRKGLVLSSLPMAVIPGITMTLIYPILISNPILVGDLKCPLCASLRAGALGLTLGSIYPFLLAIPLNSALAINYATIEVPMFSKKSSFNEALQFWQRKVRYFKGQFISIAIFQMFLFAFVADRQFRLAHTELDVQFVKEER